MTDFLSNPVFWGYFATLVPYLLFAIFYGFGSPWRSNAAGRGLMILATTLSVLLIQTLITVAVGPGWPGQGTTRVVVLVGALTAGWYLLYTLLRLQRAGRRTLRSNSPARINDFDQQASDQSEIRRVRGVARALVISNRRPKQ